MIQASEKRDSELLRLKKPKTKQINKLGEKIFAVRWRAGGSVAK